MKSYKELQEELKSNQKKLDANHNGKLDSDDFKKIRTRKKVEEKSCMEEFQLDEEKIPVQHVTDSVTKVLGTKGASKFLTHLRPGTTKHTSWHKVNNALMDQGIKPQHIASIAVHVKPAQFKEEVESVEEKFAHPNHKKIDKNKNGRLDKQDFELLRKSKEKSSCCEE